ncbi:nuclease-related domain-containing protein [Pararobbsia alpina]|uniref:nuclease-related domain-containing protein n=1 Tax=Pararobbsia alpina TaxID=621374 RepID=UPI0039A4AB94
MLATGIAALSILFLYRRSTRTRLSKGVEGERSVEAELRSVLDWLCPGEYRLFGGLIVEHAPDTDFPTAEIDHLVITPFGIFVIETINWSGKIGRSAAHDRVTRTAPGGAISERRSPVAQNTSKVRYI